MRRSQQRVLAVGIIEPKSVVADIEMDPAAECIRCHRMVQPIPTAKEEYVIMKKISVDVSTMLYLNQSGELRLIL